MVILSTISPTLTLVALAILPFMFIFAYIMNGRMRKAFRNNRVKIAEINAQIEDNLSGIRVVKSFATEDVENKKFARGNEAFLKAKKNSYFYMGSFHAGLGSFTTLIQVAIIVVGTILVANTSIDVTDLVTFLLYISVFTDPIRTLIDFTEQFQNGYSGFERFCEIMAIEPEIADKENAQTLENVRGDINFENVSFSYGENTDMVLSNVDLDVAAGSYTAIVGSSGAGKTTLCSLIPRFYDVTGGSIKLDGFDVRDVTLKSLRRQIGIVQQDVYLFAGTVYENILYGRPDATEEEVIEAAKNANAHEFIMSLPDGYNTDIGQGGDKLSTGQKQLISIARAILADNKILILDEATSSVDTRTEIRIQKAMNNLMKGRTSFVIAHRLSTIRDADLILVMKDGDIVEQGTHDELISQNGFYASLYNSQFSA